MVPHCLCAVTTFASTVLSKRLRCELHRPVERLKILIFKNECDLLNCIALFLFQLNYFLYNQSDHPLVAP